MNLQSAAKKNPYNRSGKGCSFLAAVPSDSNGQQRDEAGLNYNNWASGSGRQAEIGDDTSYKKQPAQNINQVKSNESLWSKLLFSL